MSPPGFSPHSATPNLKGVSDELTTERLRLRPLTLDDLGDLHDRVYSDPDVTWDGTTSTLEETRKSLEAKIRHAREHGFGMMAVTDRETGELYGFAGLQHMEGGPDVEIGYYLARRAWGRGLATELAARAHGHGVRRAGAPACRGRRAAGEHGLAEGAGQGRPPTRRHRAPLRRRGRAVGEVDDQRRVIAEPGAAARMLDDCTSRTVARGHAWRCRRSGLHSPSRPRRWPHERDGRNRPHRDHDDSLVGISEGGEHPLERQQAGEGGQGGVDGVTGPQPGGVDPTVLPAHGGGTAPSGSSFERRRPSRSTADASGRTSIAVPRTRPVRKRG